MRRPGRAVTVLVGIALGAAVFTSVRLAVYASLDSFTKSMDLVAGRADHSLIRPGGYVSNIRKRICPHQWERTEFFLPELHLQPAN